MAARHKDQIELDMITIAQDYLQGKTQMQIAQKLGISQQQVSIDLRKLRERWRKKQEDAIDDLQAEELAKIDELERVYWQGYEASLQKRKKATRSEVRAGNGHGEGVPTVTKIQVTEEEGRGDTSYLKGIEWCINKRCEILGLNAPLELANPKGDSRPFELKIVHVKPKPTE